MGISSTRYEMIKIGGKYPIYGATPSWRQPVYTFLDYGRWSVARRNGGTLNNRWSDDGITWNTSTTNSYGYYCIDFSPEQGLYVMVSDTAATNNIASSTNSITWTQRSKSNSRGAIYVTWVSRFNKWILCDFNIAGAGNLHTSSDAITWTIAHTFSSPYSCYSNQGFDDGTNWGVFLTTLSTPSPARIVYSNDGITFYEQNIDDGGNYKQADTRWSLYSPVLDRYICGGLDTNRIITSQGLTAGWTTYTEGATDDNSGGTWAENLFVMSQWSGPGTFGPKYSSTGLSGSWTQSTLPSSTWNFWDVEYSKELDQWVSVGTTGTQRIITSSDGIVWTLRTAAGEHIHAIFGPGIRTTAYKQGADK